jgi:acetolactate synthase-1/2/3 large subunit
MSASTQHADPAALTMSGAEVVLRALKDQGVEVIFGYPGGAVLPIYDALFQQNSIRHILVRHEQAAVHAARAMRGRPGKVGVVLVTSGPGATNAVTGLVDALMDSIPVICLTGPGADAPDRQRRLPGGRHHRHHAARRPSTTTSSRHPGPGAGDARGLLRGAPAGPGPVVIDLPKDILIGKAPYEEAPARGPHRSYRPQTEPDMAQIRKAVALLKARSGRWSMPAAA